MGDAKHVHSAAVLAASHHGDWKAALRLIRKMAKIHGVELSSLPGFGGEKVAASMVELAAKAMGDGGVPMHHGPFTGTHEHSHHLTARTPTRTSTSATTTTAAARSTGRVPRRARAA